MEKALPTTRRGREEGVRIRRINRLNKHWEIALTLLSSCKVRVQESEKEKGKVNPSGCEMQ